MRTSVDTFDVAIAGAGPAGTSAAIHLATHGKSVLLLEQKRFPRAKLCGEFISPECIAHFKQLGVSTEILSAGGAHLTETSFYSRSGSKVTVPTHWFGSDSAAIGLSRSEMDLLLLQRARSSGVTVLEDAQVSDLLFEKKRVCGVRVKIENESRDFSANLTIDATGRTRALARRISKGERERRISPDRQRASMIAFKAHFENTRIATGACEIYFYPGGYGGLSSVEGGLSNLCFIASARDVRECGSDPEKVMMSRVMKNSRAAHTLADASASSPWLSVTVQTFGRHKLVPAEGLLMIGDAAAFIDPFTGSGMLMALESGAVAAQTILDHYETFGAGGSFSEFARQYRTRYKEIFNSRLFVSGLLRRAAFVPCLAEAAMFCFGASDWLRRKVARATRPSLESTSTI